MYVGKDPFGEESWPTGRTYIPAWSWHVEIGDIFIMVVPVREGFRILCFDWKIWLYSNLFLQYECIHIRTIFAWIYIKKICSSLSQFIEDKSVQSKLNLNYGLKNNLARETRLSYTHCPWNGAQVKKNCLQIIFMAFFLSDWTQQDELKIKTFDRALILHRFYFSVTFRQKLRWSFFMHKLWN